MVPNEAGFINAANEVPIINILSNENLASMTKNQLAMDIGKTDYV